LHYKDIAKELGILVSIAVIAAFTVNYLSPEGIALFGEWDTARGVISAKPKDDVVDHDREIEDVTAAKKIFNSGNAVFIDARTRELYEEGHIKGAVSLPVGQFDLFIDKFMEEYPTDTAIVTYCSGRECDDSHRLAQYLFEIGYTKINVFIDGYPGWEAEGYPIE